MGAGQRKNISLNRRLVVQGILIAGAAGMIPFPVRGREPLQQVKSPSDTAFLERALDLASMADSRGEGTPYGAVIVRNGEIIGEGWNRMYVKKDATAHAEIEAIQDACKRLARRDLSGTVMYTNGGRPCPMCETGAYWARIDRIYYGMRADEPVDHGRPRYGGC